MSETQDPFDWPVDPPLGHIPSGRCYFCEERFTVEELDDPDAIYRQVTSWVHGKKLQSPVLREQTGMVAHKACIEKIVNGQSADQESLPGFEAPSCPSCGDDPNVDCSCKGP